MDNAKLVASQILGSKAEEPVEEESSGLPEGLMECMEELGAALLAKDFTAAAKCFQSAFDVLEAAPHGEYDEE